MILYHCQTKFNMGVVLEEKSTLFESLSDLRLTKMQLHSDDDRVLLYLFELCLATIGVVFFSASASVGALFCLWGEIDLLIC